MHTGALVGKGGTAALFYLQICRALTEAGHLTETPPGIPRQPATHPNRFNDYLDAVAKRDQSHPFATGPQRGFA